MNALYLRLKITEYLFNFDFYGFETRICKIVTSAPIRFKLFYHMQNGAACTEVDKPKKFIVTTKRSDEPEENVRK